MTVGILDYGVGNLGSVRNMFRRIDVTCELAHDSERLTDFDRLLLPGVGAFDRAAGRLADRGLADAIKEFAKTGRPILGICLGMQLLLDSSAEGEMAGLGLIPGRSERFVPREGLRVPHMGWNSVTPTVESRIFAEVATEPRFYFVHSYHAVPDNAQDVLATTPHGDDFVSMIRRDNIIGAQFHPEKSHLFGMQLLRGFADL
ncbi:imidazole glycerol phosphate synthase subunit HisH [Microbacterium aerolatum]|uniref:imidazole glycerol phosphate synthase subunit HisH n=1 Tax=Microbacterium aerolatum TaxID=153731 RepID=UPI00384D3291